jgi:lipid-A-disaccharide synthase
VELPHYGMVNLVAGREVVPELIQDGFTPQSVEREVRALLEDGPVRRRMTQALAEVRKMLRGDLAAPALGVAPETTALRAARAVLRVAENGIPKRE